jgi:hypothetical protein
MILPIIAVAILTAAAFAPALTEWAEGRGRYPVRLVAVRLAQLAVAMLAVGGLLAATQ